jgi:PhzF family phenazine biosynthesis protein
MKSVPLYIADAFTSQPFAGNPAAVCLLKEPAEEEWMQRVAAEMNLSETAFLHPVDDGYGLRWFTPTTEVDLCGHATLASSHVLAERGELPEGVQMQFHTRSGLLTARRSHGLIQIDFPADPDTEAEPDADLLPALGAQARYVGQAHVGYLVELESEAEVRSLRPDFARLAKVPTPGVVVTSVADSDNYDFVSRFFGPALGIDEDPVTGAAHCCLACFWSRRLNKTSFRAFQASARGGELRVTLTGDRVVLAGHAVTTVRGELAC